MSRIFQGVFFIFWFLTFPMQSVLAHEFSYSITVQCDPKEQIARISEDDSGDPNVNAKAHTYDFDRLPQIACNFGPRKKVLMSGGRSDDHPNNDATVLEINKPSHYMGFSIWMQYGGYISIQFDDDNGVHIQNCAKHPGDQGDVVCGKSDYKTKYKATSDGNTPSFDCSKASTVEEILICDDPELAAADLEMSRSYQQQVEVSGSKKDKLISMQEAWMHFRGAGCFMDYNSDLFPVDADHTKQCLLNSYRKRMDQLKNGQGDEPIK